MDTHDQWNIENQKPPDAKMVKFTRYLISLALGFTGLIILASQLFPLSISYVEGKWLEFKVNVLAAPVPDSYKTYVEGEFAYYDPGKSYFQNLAQKVGELSQTGNQSFDPISKKMKKIVVDKKYSKDLKLTIQDIGIKNVNVSANVESHNEKVYNLYLKSGLAHFKGTPIPGDGGNSFVYGHSAVPSFFQNHSNLAETIFTRLEDVDIGKDVIVKREGNELKYVVRKKKIVESTDFSILQQQGDKETLTLMTCWPVGIASKRLIVVAERYE